MRVLAGGSIRWCRTSAGACVASPAASGSLSLILRNPRMQRLEGAGWAPSELLRLGGVVHDARVTLKFGSHHLRSLWEARDRPCRSAISTKPRREVSFLHSLGHLQPSGANSTTSSSTSYNFTLAIGDVAPATRVVVGLREALLHPTLSSPPSLLAGGGARALLTQMTLCKFHLHRTQHTVSQTNLPKNYH